MTTEETNPKTGALHADIVSDIAYHSAPTLDDVMQTAQRWAHAQIRDLHDEVSKVVKEQLTPDALMSVFNMDSLTLAVTEAVKTDVDWGGVMHDAINMDEITSDIANDVDIMDVACHIDLSDLSEYIDVDEAVDTWLNNCSAIDDAVCNALDERHDRNEDEFVGKAHWEECMNDQTESIEEVMSFHSELQIRLNACLDRIATLENTLTRRVGRKIKATWQRVISNVAKATRYMTRRG